MFIYHCNAWLPEPGLAGVPRACPARAPGLRVATVLENRTDTYLPGRKDLLNVIQVDAISIFQLSFSTPGPEKTERHWEQGSCKDAVLTLPQERSNGQESLGPVLLEGLHNQLFHLEEMVLGQACMCVCVHACMCACVSSPHAKSNLQRSYKGMEESTDASWLINTSHSSYKSPSMLPVCSKGKKISEHKDQTTFSRLLGWQRLAGAGRKLGEGSFSSWAWLSAC